MKRTLLLAILACGCAIAGDDKDDWGKGTRGVETPEPSSIFMVGGALAIGGFLMWASRRRPATRTQLERWLRDR